MSAVDVAEEENIRRKHNRNRKKLFTNKDLWYLFIPLIIEQGLAFLTGLADSMMVAKVGEAAVSGVSLIDFIMALFISIFAALATGGAIVIGQYLGSGNKKIAGESATQLTKFALYISIIIMIFVYLIKPYILKYLFGSISYEVEQNSKIYFNIVVLSIPFIAVYNCGAAIFRTMGNSKISMKIMLVMNILNIIGNGILVLVFKMGVAGVAIPTLVSRFGAMVIILYFARNPKLELPIRNFIREKLNWEILKRMMKIGIPFGIENGLFYFGRLIVLSVVALFGTASIAANSIGNTIVMFVVLPGYAMLLGVPVIISKCIGANDYEQAEFYKKKLDIIIRLSFIASSLVVLGLMPLIVRIYNVSDEATVLVWKIVIMNMIMTILIWNNSYYLPVVFRAARDSKFPMIISTASMIIFRIIFSYILAVKFNFGMLGTWYAMFIDWIVKAIIYEIRYRKGIWKKYRLI